MDVQTFDRLTAEEKWTLVPDGFVHVRPGDAKIKTCKPDWIGPLYCKIPFPHYDTGDGTVVALETHNIYNGRLTRVVSKTQEVLDMSWSGYVSQLDDGELKLRPCNAQTSVIVGVCNGVNFKFTGSKFEYGVWPGFLLLYYANRQ